MLSGPTKKQANCEDALQESHQNALCLVKLGASRADFEVLLRPTRAEPVGAESTRSRNAATKTTMPQAASMRRDLKGNTSGR